MFGGMARRFEYIGNAGRYAVLGITILFAACVGASPQTGVGVTDARGRCGAPNDGRQWSSLRTPPLNASGYRQLADQNPTLRIPLPTAPEYWFAFEDRLLLCRAEGTPQDAPTGEWWEFKSILDDGPVLVSHSAWVIVI